jgi:hypothetical protein
VHCSSKAKTPRRTGDQDFLVLESSRWGKGRKEELVGEDDFWHSQHLGDCLKLRGKCVYRIQKLSRAWILQITQLGDIQLGEVY